MSGVKIIEKTTEDELSEKLYPQIVELIKKDKWAWQALGAIFGFGCGALTILVAVITNIALWFVPSGDTEILLKRISFISFIAFLPLMLIGAHFLDLIERKHFDI